MDSAANSAANSATNIQGDISVQDDGTWCYRWGWTFAGSRNLSQVHEEVVITNLSGMIIDYRAEQAHMAEPGAAYVGSGSGNTKIPPGQVSWSLRVISGDAYLGMTSGTLTSSAAPGT